MMRGSLIAAGLLAAAALPAAGLPEAARHSAEVAERDAGLLRRRADAAALRDAALRAEGVRLAARVQAAERVSAARTAAARAAARQAEAADARLAALQHPLVALAGGIGVAARTPMLAMLLRPGTLTEQVHLRAALASALPAVKARSAAVRAQAQAAGRLRQSADEAAEEARASTATLRKEQAALATLQRQAHVHTTRIDAAARAASERALVSGESTRLAMEGVALGRQEAAVLAATAALPQPRPRPGGSAAAILPTGAYRLPAIGRVVEGHGERRHGTAARALSLVAAPGALVVAPAGGRVRFAGPFRDYAGVVILDHGGGWTSVLTGLGEVAGASGSEVAQGSPLGTAGQRPITVELRRDGRSVPVSHMVSGRSPG